MENDTQNHHGNIPHPSAELGNVQNNSESFGTVPNNAEPFRSIPHISERKANHTLTVREVARLFEAAGVARTERSIVNWCQPNRTGIARLDSYFDPNERRYYISPQSVESAIAEEKAKAAKNNVSPEPSGDVPQPAEIVRSPRPSVESDESKIKELEHEILDQKILNKGKEFLIDELNKERKSFFDQLLAANKEIGELNYKLLQLESPARPQIEAETE